MKPFICLIIPAILLASCDPTAKELSQEVITIKDMEWLKGKWIIQSGSREFHEHWYPVNDTLYSAVSFMLYNGDTVFREEVRLLQDGEGLWYIPAVSNQNRGEPVPFRFTGKNEGEFVFENPEHDFPRRIIYTHPHPDSLYARIEGGQDSTFRKQEFFMSRVKEMLQLKPK